MHRAIMLIFAAMGGACAGQALIFLFSGGDHNTLVGVLLLLTSMLCWLVTQLERLRLQQEQALALAQENYWRSVHREKQGRA